MGPRNAIEASLALHRKSFDLDVITSSKDGGDSHERQQQQQLLKVNIGACRIRGKNLLMEIPPDVAAACSEPVLVTQHIVCKNADDDADHTSSSSSRHHHRRTVVGLQGFRRDSPDGAALVTELLNLPADDFDNDATLLALGKRCGEVLQPPFPQDPASQDEESESEAVKPEEVNEKEDSSSSSSSPDESVDMRKNTFVLIIVDEKPSSASSSGSAAVTPSITILEKAHTDADRVFFRRGCASSENPQQLQHLPEVASEEDGSTKSVVRVHRLGPVNAGDVFLLHNYCDLGDRDQQTRRFGKLLSRCLDAFPTDSTKDRSGSSESDDETKDADLDNRPPLEGDYAALAAQLLLSKPLKGGSMASMVVEFLPADSSAPRANYIKQHGEGTEVVPGCADLAEVEGASTKPWFDTMCRYDRCAVDAAKQRYRIWKAFQLGREARLKLRPCERLKQLTSPEGKPTPEEVESDLFYSAGIEEQPWSWWEETFIPQQERKAMESMK